MQLARTGPLALLALGALTLASACDLFGKGSSSGSGGSGGSGGATTATTTATTGSGLKGCDAQPTCDACTQCATKGACSAQVSACLADPSCSGLDQCIGLCANDAACKTQCIQQNQVGVDAYNAAFGCLYCTECPHACKGYATCN